MLRERHAWFRPFLSADSGKLVRGRDMKIEIRLRIDAGDGGLGDEELLVSRAEARPCRTGESAMAEAVVEQQ